MPFDPADWELPGVSPLTYKVVAYKQIRDLPTNEIIDWAYEMLLLGHDTPNLVMLAGINKPASFYDVAPYLKEALKELHLPELVGDDAEIAYGYILVKNVANKTRVKESLRELYELYDSFDMASVFGDFAMLWWAWNDLDYDNYQSYWPYAALDNIEVICVNEARNWLEDHKDVIDRVGI